MIFHTQKNKSLNSTYTKWKGEFVTKNNFLSAFINLSKNSLNLGLSSIYSLYEKDNKKFMIGLHKIFIFFFLPSHFSTQFDASLDVKSE
jgi:hypothetical protein